VFPVVEVEAGLPGLMLPDELGPACPQPGSMLAPYSHGDDSFWKSIVLGVHDWRRYTMQVRKLPLFEACFEPRGDFENPIGGENRHLD
jgi:hypothetical protein